MMNSHRARDWFLILSCLGATVARGFDPADPFAQSRPGDWLKYRVSIGDRSSLLRQAVISKGEETITFEVESELKSADRTLLSVIEVVEKLGSREVVTMRMKTGDGRVVDLSGMAAEVGTSMRAKDPFGKDGANWKAVGPEKVSVPAGTFACARYRREEGESSAQPRLDVWICPDQPHTGVVRMESSAGFRMELLASGRDAVSSFP